MRSTILLLLIPTLAVAEPAKQATATVERESLWEAEIQLGYGISKRGSEEMTETSSGPISFAALGAIAINEEPRVYAIGGLVGEALERQAIGATAGVRLQVPNTPVRLTGTGVYMVAPKTLWGATASAGACFGKGTIGLCGDVQLTAYIAGSALPQKELELHAAFVLGVVFRGGM